MVRASGLLVFRVATDLDEFPDIGHFSGDRCSSRGQRAG
jgi:hypothetical protein